ncbi:hypothetical protein [Aestuariispira insulae]|uniref:Uncharacterized protein n=1 Tax=Aestuariispira insulae TaxID=1461337 RepID=A0A3D9HRR0_9PROT|nr:hypothetical protein [Aestuariispira insulae]RED52182.1 hypothetical protein DFP90_102200 [Aestuariispira insulae]
MKGKHRTKRCDRILSLAEANRVFFEQMRRRDAEEESKDSTHEKGENQ